MTVTSSFPILSTRDLPTLVEFYRRSLAAEVTFRFEDGGVDVYVSLTIAGASLGIGSDPHTPPQPDGDRVALWFYVTDVNAAYAGALDAGASDVHAPLDMPWGERVAQVRDPAGHLLNLAEPPAVA